MIDIDNLKALLAKATPGPWEATHNTLHEESRIYAGSHQRAMLDGRVLLREREDAELIVALRNAAPALLAELAELRAYKERTEEALLDVCCAITLNNSKPEEETHAAFYLGFVTRRMKRVGLWRDPLREEAKP